MAPPQTAARQGFADLVVSEVYDRSPLVVAGDNDTLPDDLERLHQAVTLFLEASTDNPFLFPDVTDAVAWVFATYRNLRRWKKPAPQTADIEDLNALPSPGAPRLLDDTPGAATVVLRYFARTDAPHTGRLSLTEKEVEVLRAVADTGLSDAGHKVRPATYDLLAETLSAPREWIQDTYYNAKRAFATIYYVVGALGPPDALHSVEELDRAVATFRRAFRGQNAWSILSFAARSADVLDGYARVNPDHYTAAILSTPRQAGRLGWRPDGPSPPYLLHHIESQAATAFGTRHPRCVLCGCARHNEGSPA